MVLKGEFLWSSPPQDVYLLPQRPNLCLERCPRPEQIDNRPTNKSAKIPHPTTGLPDSRSTASRIGLRQGQPLFIECPPPYLNSHKGAACVTNQVGRVVPT
jgi:hypothetical protein